MEELYAIIWTVSLPFFIFGGWNLKDSPVFGSTLILIGSVLMGYSIYLQIGGI